MIEDILRQQERFTAERPFSLQSCQYDPGCDAICELSHVDFPPCFKTFSFCASNTLLLPPLETDILKFEFLDTLPLKSHQFYEIFQGICFCKVKTDSRQRKEN